MPPAPDPGKVKWGMFMDIWRVSKLLCMVSVLCYPAYFTHLHVQYIDFFLLQETIQMFVHLKKLVLQAIPHSSREQGLESTHTQSCSSKMQSFLCFLNYIQNSIYKHVYTLQLHCSLFFLLCMWDWSG